MSWFVNIGGSIYRVCASSLNDKHNGGAQGKRTANPQTKCQQLNDLVIYENEHTIYLLLTEARDITWGSTSTYVIKTICNN